MFGIYKYVYNDEIIYIGKSDNSILNRVNAHVKEAKFKPYLEKAVIYYTECKNRAHTHILETFLINKYKPILNDSLKYEEDLDFDIPEPEWHLLSELKEVEETVKQVKKPGIKWYENRVNDIEVLKRKIKNLEWLESFLQRFFGMYNIEFSVDYSEENLEKYERLFESFSLIDEGCYGGFNLGTSLKVDKNKMMIHVSTLRSNLKEEDFWNNYEIIFQKTKDEHLKEISQLISKIQKAGYDYEEQSNN
ncbi:GIY-YIG nuclease family protein [Ruminococcus flavefaciens]|uniref:GIY-YIG nuclease family protein n=1 Tax=Ruminococcus flavefaciens TaxID=1265 RepID=UPI0026EB5BDE|nr:GIY-YIG nuclease family protein [Ruminococcus flavefaciens]